MSLKKWGLAIGFCVLVATALFVVKTFQISSAMQRAASFPEPMETVEFAIAESGSWTPSIEVIAETLATQSIELRNELAGVVAEVHVQAGQTVNQGQPFLRLETDEERAKLAARQADLKLAETNYRRMLLVVEKGAASEAVRDQAEATRDSLTAEVQELEATIGKKNIRAPFDAVAGLHAIEVGQYMTPGELITTLVGVSNTLWVNFSLPQQLAKLNVGDLIDISADGFYEGTRKAIIIARDSVADTSSRNVRFRAEINNDDGLLISGMALVAKVPTGTAQTGQVVPGPAIRYDSNGSFVFKLEPVESDAPRGTHRANKVYVELNGERDQQVLVIDGLLAGDMVAAVGSFKLREGVLVNALTPAGSAE
ncbi:MAG: efflux RND transporter periplasmic adaptor subunit [Proteobacteria bacterium]|nr:efflux RND transporter periplasmic adaptor subunit [Pseudomonadota bacterium]